MAQLANYFIGTKGTLWVKQPNGHARRATAKEWLKVWKSDPRFTLELVQQLGR